VTGTLVIGTAGHIDHGKSALVRALTGIDPDRLKEEQARGITIELGFAHTTIGPVEVAFVDVPGHERFVRTMLAGAGGVDAVLLVVAADESVMPQTREHFEICRLLAIPRGLIVITKSDAADRDTIELAALEARELVAGSPLAGARIVVVSARTGEGLEELRTAIADLASAVPASESRGVARLPIDRAFSVRGFGTVVTGTLVSGELREGDTLELLPPQKDVRVRGAQVHGRPAAMASAPRRVAVNLGGLDLEDVARGMTLATKDTVAVTRRVDVAIELLPGARVLKHGSRVRVHQGTGDHLGRVSVSSVRLRPGPGRDPSWRRVDVGASDADVPEGGEGLVRLRLASPAVLTRGDRVVLRAASPSVTIGGGVVLDPEPPTGGIRRARAAERLIALTATDPLQWVGTFLVDAGLRGLSGRDLIRRGGLTPLQAERVSAELVTNGAAVRAGDVLLDAVAARHGRDAIIGVLKEFHRAQPEEPGMPREVVRDRVQGGAVFDALLASLGAAVTGTDRLALATHRPVVSGDDARVMAGVEEALKEAGMLPPDLATMAARVAAPAALVQKALLALQKLGRVQRLDVLWFHASTLTALKTDVKALGAGATIDVASAKAKFGVSRKYAIPLLEYLDRERITRRIGDRRVVI